MRFQSSGKSCIEIEVDLQMKVLLVNPSIAQAEVYAKYSAGAPCLPPLGLCYLAAVLLEQGHDVEILDCVVENLSLPQLKSKLREIKPDIVGVTANTVSFEAAKKTLKTIKDLDEDIITVLGGAHLSALPCLTMEECKDIDVGVFGEGEYTLLEVVNRLEKRQSLQGVDGAIFRQNGDIIENNARRTVKDLDEIPFPARHLLKDLRAYSHTPFRGAKFMTTVITSRGCVFDCGFCDQSVFGRTWRYHSSEHVVSEISFLKDRYGIDFISFEDDNFMVSKKRTIDICQEMIRNDFKIAWSCLGHINEVNEEVLPLMKRAGCRTIYLGIESGSPRILELVNKKVSLEEIKKGIELIKKYGINVTGSFILGLPTETREEIEKTVDFAIDLPLDGVSFFTFTPYPNTSLRELAFKHGKVSEKWRDYSGHPNSLPFIPNGFEEKEILDIQRKAYKRFLLRPGYVAKHLGAFFSRKALRDGLKFLKALVFK